MGAGVCWAVDETDYFRPGRWSLPGDALGAESKWDNRCYYVVSEAPWTEMFELPQRIREIRDRALNGDLTAMLYIASFYIYGISLVTESPKANQSWDVKEIIAPNWPRAHDILTHMAARKHPHAAALLAQIPNTPTIAQLPANPMPSLPLSEFRPEDLPRPPSPA